MNIKKSLVFCFVLLIMLLPLSGCSSKPFTCFLCGNEVEGKKYKGQLFGEEISICQNCNDSMNALNEALSESSK